MRIPGARAYEEHIGVGTVVLLKDPAVDVANQRALHRKATWLRSRGADIKQRPRRTTGVNAVKNRVVDPGGVSETKEWFKK